MSKHYICAICGGKFVYATADAEEKAKRECAANFPDVPLEECAMVCDGCYQRVLPTIRKQQANN